MAKDRVTIYPFTWCGEVEYHLKWTDYRWKGKEYNVAGQPTYGWKTVKGAQRWAERKGFEVAKIENVA